MRALHNLTTGRGIGLGISSLLGKLLGIPLIGAIWGDLRGGWIPSDIGNIFTLTIAVGPSTAPLTFPKMTFKLKGKDGKPLSLHEESKVSFRE